MTVVDDLDDLRVRALELALKFHRLSGLCAPADVVITAKLFAAYLDPTEALSLVPEPKASEQHS